CGGGHQQEARTQVERATEETVFDAEKFVHNQRREALIKCAADEPAPPRGVMIPELAPGYRVTCWLLSWVSLRDSPAFPDGGRNRSWCNRMETPRVSS